MLLSLKGEPDGDGGRDSAGRTLRQINVADAHDNKMNVP
jgi:hypothetical protein